MIFGQGHGLEAAASRESLRQPPRPCDPDANAALIAEKQLRESHLWSSYNQFFPNVP